MGSSASTRSKAQAKAAAAAAAGTKAFSAAVCDVTSGSSVPLSGTTNAGGDIGGSRQSPSPAVDPSAGPDSATAKMSVTSEAPQFSNEKSESSTGKEKSDEAVEDVEGSSTEDSTSTGEADVKSKTSRPTLTENTRDFGEDDPRLEKTPSEDDQQSATKVCAAPNLRDVACQSDCITADHDDPVLTDFEAPPPSPQPAHHSASNDNDQLLSGNEIPPSPGSEEVRCTTDDDKAAVVPESHHHTCGAVSPSRGEAILKCLQEIQCLSSTCQLGDHHKVAMVCAAQHQEVDVAAGAAEVASHCKQQQQPFTISASSCAAGDDQQQHVYPHEDGFSAGLKGPPCLETVAVHCPAAREGSSPGEMEGDSQMEAVADPQKKSSPVCDVIVCEGAHRKVISVKHDGNDDNSDNLPLVD